jgi:HK97 family phage major capsid protein
MFDFTNIEAAELLERRKAIGSEAETATGEGLSALEEELDAINAELATRKAAEDKRQEIRDAVAAGEGTVIDSVEMTAKNEKENRNMFGIETKEYRDAFMANLFGNATDEQRSILADNTNYGDGLALPVALDERIWDQVCSAHPILADIDVRRTGVAIKVTKMTPATVSAKMDKTTTSELTFTSAEVTLVGKDFHTFVKLSFAEAKMSQGAMEDFLVKEIADVLGEAMAKDVFARILTDVGSAATTYVSGTNTYFGCLQTALGAASLANNPVIYAPAALYYALIGEQDSAGQPIVRDGVAMGAQVKKDNAATKITIVDPSMFVLNVIQDVQVESAKNLEEAKYVISGYARAEGCLRKTLAAAYIA